MVVALTMIFYLEWARNITSYTMIVAAFLGSLLCRLHSADVPTDQKYGRTSRRRYYDRLYLLGSN